MEERQDPLVSCIMPTYNRRNFVPSAIEYFLRQDYQNKELIVIDDGTDYVEDLIPQRKEIRYYRLEKKITLGAKLNLACEYARGEIIANWDDDDWYAPWRLTYQVKALQPESKEVCGINNLFYYDLLNNDGYNYIYPPRQKVWLIGSSQCYTKKLWQSNKFANINVGMDGLFVWATPIEKVKVLEDSTFSVHMIHQTNVSEKKTKGTWWHPYPVENIQGIIGEDWITYSNYAPKKLKEKKSINSLPQSPINISPEASIQNVFACLVHEKEDSIIDLVRNLHFHDPNSLILLYDGSNNTHLNKSTFSYSQFNTVWHPNPKPQKHGYLHGFALDCMEYAMANFTFDTLTIVDSDQLCIQSGYSNYLASFLEQNSNAGLLSSNPVRVSSNDKKNHVALKAHKEYQLWKPLLDLFPDGESKFVHWTFWPSTVFTQPAISDLLQLFSENKILQNIMKHTKVWATEEVIFPTLIRLLGYDILSNPCSHDYVKYKVKYNLDELKQAIQKENSYWIHPIDRKFDNLLRKQIRKHYSYYNPINNRIQQPSKEEPFSFINLLENVKNIKGWLTNKEADYLINIALKAGMSSKAPFVEIGSYHGKATIILASIIQAYFPKNKVVSIDTHDGKLGALDQEIKIVQPSFRFLKRNIEKARLSPFVEIHKMASYQVEWKHPISFLLIDGLHDYPSVVRDFNHFEEHLIADGYVAFHDYADYYPGVMAFVYELLATKNYSEVNQTDSLIVLRKEKLRL